MDKTSAMGGIFAWKRARHSEASNVQTGASGKNKTENTLYINETSLKNTLDEHSHIDYRCEV